MILQEVNCEKTLEVKKNPTKNFYYMKFSTHFFAYDLIVAY